MPSDKFCHQAGHLVSVRDCDRCPGGEPCKTRMRVEEQGIGLPADLEGDTDFGMRQAVTRGATKTDRMAARNRLTPVIEFRTK